MTKKNTNVTSGIILLVCIGAGLFIGACSMFEFEPVVMTPISIPGATYIGSEICATCHEDQYKYFSLTDHASVSVDISSEDAEAGQAEACETCHGPASLHIEDTEDKTRIVRMDPEVACFNCHLDIKGKFMLQHHHPVPEGRMTCVDCHDMHGSDVRATGGNMLSLQDEKCFACHKEMKGPFIFPHEAMREGCTACHNPHGSINDKLLVAGPAITCLRCHIEGDNGEFHHNYPIGVSRDCADCHTRVHGSNNAKSSLRY